MSKFEVAWAANAKFECGGTATWLNQFWTPSSNVPVDQAAVLRQKRFYFSEPTDCFPHPLVIALDKREPHDPLAAGQLKCCSPEDHYVLLLCDQIESLTMQPTQ